MIDPTSHTSLLADMPLLRAAAARGWPDYRWEANVKNLEWLAGLSAAREMRGQGPYAAMLPGNYIDFEPEQELDSCPDFHAWCERRRDEWMQEVDAV